MQIMFMSRHEFTNLCSQLNSTQSAIISISDNTEEMEEMQRLVETQAPTARVIYLAFQDVDDHDCGGITNNQARKLFKFIKQNNDCSFYVHCFAGVSRSAAVAKFIQEYYDVQGTVLENYRIYNNRVFSKLMSFVGSMSIEDYYRQLEAEERGYE
jgi:predicted protein tyrosine phosphatase